MTPSTADIVRAALRAAEDGMTLNDIATQTGVPYRAVHRAVTKMPDAYIDRWQQGESLCHSAVWCVVVPPPHCPRPKKSKRTQPKPGEPQHQPTTIAYYAIY